jgi:iron(III) transport system permease protein
LINDPHIFEPVRNSVIMSAGTLLFALVIGVIGAYVVTKGVTGRLRILLDVLITLPYAIPGTVIAITLILTLASPTVVSGYAVLVGTFWILPIAYLIRTYPLIVRSTAASLEQFDDTLMEAGASFGAGILRQFRKIALPLILPGIVSGSLLCLIATLGEFVSSILLYTYETRPISVEIFSQLRSYNFGAAAGYCVVLLVLITVLIMLGDRLVRRISLHSEGINF